MVCSPAHQFPTGATLAPDRRVALVALARERDLLVLEDDYDAEFRYDRAPVGSLQGIEPQRVLYAGSVSKTLAPALRLGWLLVPPSLVEEAVRRKRLADLGSPTLDQLALADLLERGEIDHHLRRVRRRYRDRRDALVAALAERLPAARVRGISAGLHLLVELPGGDDEAVAARALELGVAVEPVSRHRVRPGPPGLVLGFGRVSEPSVGRAVELLARAVGDA
jgi:GntR family transcriptional regulator/MocR family aminotransferase